MAEVAGGNGIGEPGGLVMKRTTLAIAIAFLCLGCALSLRNPAIGDLKQHPARVSRQNGQRQRRRHQLVGITVGAVPLS